MVLPLNDLKFSQLNTEMSRLSSAQYNMDDSEGRKLASAGNTGQNTSSGTQIKASNWLGHARAKITPGSTTYNVNLLSAVQAVSYATGKTYATYTINPGVVIASSSTGTPALTIPGGFSSGDLLEVTNSGRIQGAGGDGGVGGDRNLTYGRPGNAGGTALAVAFATTFTNAGSIWGGGGGGGGGNGKAGGKGIESAGGGGGGGGAGSNALPNTGGAGGAGGAASRPGGAGNYGTWTAGGAGGSGNPGGGGSGGGPGSAGLSSSGAGGAAGNSITGLGFLNGGAGVSGDILGPQS